MLFSKNSAASEVLTVPSYYEREVSSFMIQVRGNAWTGTLTLASRLSGSGLPFAICPYQNLTTLADVAAGTTITGDGKYAVRADGDELQITHALTGGTVDIAVKPLRG